MKLKERMNASELLKIEILRKRMNASKTHFGLWFYKWRIHRFLEKIEQRVKRDLRS
ncbi:MAG: hypothetical protein R3267_10860 [Paenisporosarcina sp.]|nr:hypothetical protein [Paenisporosarcina sp.]